MRLVEIARLMALCQLLFDGARGQRSDLERGIREFRLEVTRKLEEQDAQIQTLQEQINTVFPHCRCDFMYGGACYWIVIHEADDINYAEGEKICKSHHSVVSYPVDATHYQLMLANMRSKIPSDRGWVDAWTGIRKTYSGITIPFGGRTPYVKWRPSQPDNKRYENKVYMYARSDPSSSNQGMGDLRSSVDIYGVICEYKP